MVVMELRRAMPCHAMPSQAWLNGDCSEAWKSTELDNIRNHGIRHGGWRKEGLDGQGQGLALAGICALVRKCINQKTMPSTASSDTEMVHLICLIQNITCIQPHPVTRLC